MKKLSILILVLIASSFLVYAHAGDNFNDTKQIINSNISCNELSDDQLEEIGEYYMEQMHPGEAHDLMHGMMGLEEGTPEEKQFHINMARNIYCGENRYGMMGGMMNMMNFGGMMGGYDGYGMMGSGYFGLYNILGILFLIGLVVLVWLWVIKLWKDIQRKK